MAEPTATNPQTGEKVVFRGGQWVPLTGAPASGGPVYGAPPKPVKPDAPKTTYRTLTPSEVAARGLPAGSYQISSEGKIDTLTTPKPADAPPPVDAAQMRLLRDEARQKIALIDSLHRRSKNGYFTTGFGAKALSWIGGTPSYDVSHDLDTLKAAGALQRVMEMSRANGGKNPLTPLSNSDFKALGDSITSLDQGLSDQKFQENLQVMRNLYLRAFKAAGGSTYMGDRNNGGKPVAPSADDALINKYLKGGH